MPCSQPLFTVQSRGSYLIGRQSLDVDDAFQFDVKLSRMWVTPQDGRIVNLLNEDMGDDVCAQVGSWRAGARQDVTSTGGCAMLGLKVPVMAFELVRLEKEHHDTLLFMGQGHTIRTQDLQEPSDLPLRSTSFQAPLVWCGAVTSPNATQTDSVREHSEAVAGANEVTADLKEDAAPQQDSFNVKYLQLKPQYAMQTVTDPASDASTCARTCKLLTHLPVFLLLSRWLIQQ